MNYSQSLPDGIARYPPPLSVPAYTAIPPYSSAGNPRAILCPPPYVVPPVKTFSPQSHPIALQPPQPVQQFPLPLAVPPSLPNMSMASTSVNGSMHMLSQSPQLIPHQSQAILPQISPHVVHSPQNMIPAGNHHVMSPNSQPLLAIPHQYMMPNQTMSLVPNTQIIAPPNCITPTGGPHFIQAVHSVGPGPPSINHGMPGMVPLPQQVLPSPNSQPVMNAVSLPPSSETNYSNSNSKLKVSPQSSHSPAPFCTPPPNIYTPMAPQTVRSGMYPGPFAYVQRPMYNVPVYASIFPPGHNSAPNHAITVPMPNTYGPPVLPAQPPPIIYQPMLNAIPAMQPPAIATTDYIPQ